METWHKEDVKKENCLQLSILTNIIYGSIWKRSADENYYLWKLYKGGRGQAIGKVATTGERIVGYQGTCHRRIRYAQNQDWASELGDSMVHPDFRRQGMWEKLTAKVIDDAVTQKFFPVYGFPNKNSCPGYINKLSMEIFFYVLRFALPLRPEALLFYKKKIPYFLAKSIVFVFNKLRLVFHKLFFLFSPNLQIIKDVKVDKWVDILWKEESRYCEAGIVKDSDYLKWRFELNPDNYTIYKALDKHGNCKGFIVTKIRAMNENLKFGFIADFLIPERKFHIFYSLLKAAEKDFIDNRVSLIDAWSTDHPFYRTGLILFGFLPADKLPFIVPRQQGAMLKEKGWANSKKWVLSMADSDNI